MRGRGWRLPNDDGRGEGWENDEGFGAEANWDVEKRSREIERRLARLRWVEEKQREEYGGWKGVWRAVVGRKKVSGKELFQKMLDEADGMMTAMSGVGQSEEVMDKIMQLGGVGFLGGDGGGWGSPRGSAGWFVGGRETQKSGGQK